jgi:hypothetical protein
VVWGAQNPSLGLRSGLLSRKNAFGIALGCPSGGQRQLLNLPFQGLLLALMQRVNEWKLFPSLVARFLRGASSVHDAQIAEHGRTAREGVNAFCHVQIIQFWCYLCFGIGRVLPAV